MVEGEEAELFVKFESKEKATVTWYRERQVIKQSTQYKITSDSSTSTLKVVKCSKEVAGKYTVEISNSKGKEESTAELVVKGLCVFDFVTLALYPCIRPLLLLFALFCSSSASPLSLFLSFTESLLLASLSLSLSFSHLHPCLLPLLPEKAAKKQKEPEQKPEAPKQEPEGAAAKSKKQPEKEQASSSKEPEVKPAADAAVKAAEKDPKKEVKTSSDKSSKEDGSTDTSASLDKPKKASLVPQIQVEKEKSPAPEDAKRGSTGKVPLLKEPEQGAPGSRRGSFIDPSTGQRRGSFIINEPGKEGSELLGATLKKAPSRRGSEARRGSVAEDDPAEKPSVPLKPIPGPGPKIIDCQPNQSATEGKTAVIQFNVQGDPVPTFQFFKDDTEIFEGGRYKMVTDGSQNNLIMFCIRKSKVADEGKYKFVAKNSHGQDQAEVQLFVGGEEGMDFRAMLRKGKKAPPKKRDDDPDFGNLKSVESERKASIKEMKVGPGPGQDFSPSLSFSLSCTTHTTSTCPSVSPFFLLFYVILPLHPTPSLTFVCPFAFHYSSFSFHVSTLVTSLCFIFLFLPSLSLCVLFHS